MSSEACILKYLIFARYLNAKGNHNGSLELPAYGLMVLGFGFFSIGTFTYMRRVAVLRSVMQLKTLEVGVMWAHSLIGLLAWVASASFLVTDGFSNRKLQWMQHMVQVIHGGFALAANRWLFNEPCHVMSWLLFNFQLS